MNKKHVVLCGKRIISICESIEVADILAAACNSNPLVVKMLGIHTVEPISNFDFNYQPIKDFLEISLTLH